MNDLQLFKEIFDPYLKNFLDKKTQKTTKHTKDPYIQNYINYAKTIIMSGGKRIRPFITYLMYKALGGKEKVKALKLLVSLELFHSFCLVHDDIMDNAGLRHNVSTVNKHVVDILRKEKRQNDLNHVGNSQAILIGDLLFSWSQEILNLNKDFNEKTINNVKTLFYEMAEEVIVGQMIDVDITTRKKVSKKLIDEKTQLKTSGYSFIKPLQIGAALSGKETKQVGRFCSEFGLRMGIAFQTQDDLLDVTSNEQQLQKTISDKSQNQHTYFTHFKSLQDVREIIQKNFDEAKVLVRNFSMKDDANKRFFNLIDLIQTRTF